MLDRLITQIPTLFRRLFPLSIAVMGIFYLRWLWLDPIVLQEFANPTDAFIWGMIVLAPFVPLALSLQRSKGVLSTSVLVAANIIFLLLNAFYLIIHMPSIEASASCNGNTYFITYGAPFGDEQWTYRQLTIWRGPFRFESEFFGYAPGMGPSRFVCDAAQGETNIVSNLGDGLRYTDGPNPRAYAGGEWGELNGYYYFLSDQWANPSAVCSDPCYGREELYTLFKCTENYTDCHALPISYTTRDADGFAVRANLETQTVAVYQLSYWSNNETLLFIYGSKPQCFVRGCILKGN